MQITVPEVCIDPPVETTAKEQEDCHLKLDELNNSFQMPDLMDLDLDNFDLNSDESTSKSYKTLEELVYDL